MRLSIVKLIKCITRNTVPWLLKRIKVDENTVLFVSFHGRGMTDNPMAIYEELKKENKYTLIWALSKDGMEKAPKDVEAVPYASLKYLYYLGRSKYWVFNCKMPEYVTKKEEQIYLQTWHGTPLKRLARDIIVPEGTTFYRSEMSFQEMVKSYDKDVNNYNYMVSPNSFTTEVFQSAFGIEKKKLIETGYPRNDILSKFTEEESQHIRKKYNIPAGKKVILYAPTWRDNHYKSSGYVFHLEVEFAKWKEKLGEEYVILFKPHYLISNGFDLKAFEGFVYLVPAQDEISDLYIISDILVTDYSSVFFDYAVLNRPIYFYMFDLEHYKNELRGFYIDIYTELPGQIYTKEEQLIEDMSKQNYDYEQLKEFNTRFNNMEDGNASKRVVEAVFPNENKKD